MDIIGKLKKKKTIFRSKRNTIFTYFHYICDQWIFIYFEGAEIHGNRVMAFTTNNLTTNLATHKLLVIKDNFNYCVYATWKIR